MNHYESTKARLEKYRQNQKKKKDLERKKQAIKLHGVQMKNVEKELQKAKNFEEIARLFHCCGFLSNKSASNIKDNLIKHK